MNNNTPHFVEWIAVDWGTSNLRIWGMGSGNTISHQVKTDEGMASLKPHQFEATLVSHISPWLPAPQTQAKPIPVIACGMVGASQGWLEAPYQAVPTQHLCCTVKVAAQDARLEVRIISGLKQANPPDVMRGEETQIAGFLLNDPSFSGVLCLPGTHSKWVRISCGEVVSFKTVMTGEIFALLSNYSVLRHSLGDWDNQVFIESALKASSHNQDSFLELFSIRSLSLLQGDTFGKARLSGMLIGAESSGMRPLWQDQEVVVIGESRLASLYAQVLQALKQKVSLKPADDLSLLGLQKAYSNLYDN